MTGGAGRRRLAPRRPAGVPVWAVDLLLGLALCAGDLVVFQGTAQVTPANVALVLPGFLVLAVRRRAPWAVLLVVVGHAAAITIVRPGLTPTLALVCGLYTVAAHRSMRSSLEALALSALVYLPASVERERLDADAALSVATQVQLVLVTAAFLTVAWAVGRWAASSRATIVTLEERRRRAAAEAVVAERKRMARELHDVVSHGVSTMVLQAAGARRVLAADPERAQEALGRIENLGKESMIELRRLLGVLRAGDFVDVDGTDDADRPGLDRVDDLVATFRDGGLDVRREVVGHPQPLDGSVDLSAFRVVQESLTNAAKHASPGASVRIREVWADEALVLEIVNRGTPGTSGQPSAAASAGLSTGLSTGHGLVGLQERARAVGGRLEAGPLPDGAGFRVSAALPIRGRALEQEEVRRST